MRLDTQATQKQDNKKKTKQKKTKQNQTNGKRGQETPEGLWAPYLVHNWII